GRCAWLVIVDADTLEWTAIENTAAMAGSGAGIQAAQTVAKAGAEAVIAGNYGPNAYQTLAAGGIAAYLGGPGMTVREAVQAFKEGRLQPAGGPTAPGHFGMGGGSVGGGMGPGMGGGMGGARGMGGGRGRGCGGGGGMGGGRGYGGGRGRRGLG
ncbi:MAG: NifB/NifX family molybdenum-iron cluster-binding protein, partial [Armatimonadetes bacterium]|nr:NifB/NifX family molybdenum-iron cluster-binding protein [Armatimonadota bacterium]